MVDKTRQAQPRSRLRKGYHIDLSDLHAQFEANYHRLMRLFPSYEQESRCIFEAGEVSVVLEVTARDRYTTDMRLRYQGVLSDFGTNSYFDLRLYHDARRPRLCTAAPPGASRPAIATPTPTCCSVTKSFSRTGLRQS